MKSISNLDRLNIITKKINNSKEYIKFLEFSKSFYNLDFKNQLLIFLQFPGATKVNTFIGWKKEGRNVKKNPHKIFLYGYYRKKQDELLEGQLDIKGKENKKRKVAVEYINDIPYRKTCNYDFQDTYIDRKRRVPLKFQEIRNDCSEEDFYSFLKEILPINIVEEKAENRIIAGKNNVAFYSNLSLFQNISLIIHEFCHNMINQELNIENMLLKKFIGESVGFSVANFFEYDTNIYNFDDFCEYFKLDLIEKIEIGTIMQKKSKEIIDLIQDRL